MCYLKNISPKMQEVLIAFAVFLFSLFVFYPNEYSVGHDMASYLAVAKNFVVGNGMIDVQGNLSNHRFGYKLILAAALWLGEKVNNELAIVFYVQMFFCALTAFLAYGLARLLFDRAVALLSYGFFVLCPSIPAKLTAFGLDGVWPAFVLGSLLLLLYAVNKGRSIWLQLGLITLSAISAGMAIWVKEATGFNYLLIPLLLFVCRATPIKLYQLVYFYGVVAVMFYLGHGIIDLLGGTLGQDSSNEQRSFKSALYFAQHYYHDFMPLSFALFMLDGLRGYLFTASFSQNIHLFYPVFFVLYGGIVYALLRAFKYKEKNYAVILICLAAYLPYIAWASQWHMRFVQLVFVLILISIFIACFIRKVHCLLVEGGIEQPARRKLYNVMAYILVIGLLFYQYSSSKYNAFYLDDNPYLSKVLVLIQGSKEVSFKGYEDVDELRVYADGEGRIQLITESITYASGVHFALPHNVQPNVGLYHRMMLGVHENPYIPYVDETMFSDVRFACLRNPIRKGKKRYGELFAFVPSRLYDYVSKFAGQSYLYISGSQDCTDLLLDWMENDAPHQGFIITPLKGNKDDATFINFYHVELTGAYQERDNAMKYSEALRTYLDTLAINDSFAYDYYRGHYPFLYPN
ncbi:MAG: glycosyltransferase family 39 protein [Alphaproteobacteria bacterium]|nr:glycosyltransferase family 39 protein [Alphaproteobacteria bacterium]